MKIFLRIICLSLLFAVLITAAVVLLFPRSVGAEETLPTENENPTRAGADRVTRFLVMGCDRSAKLTDTMFVLTLNESTAQASILQIPRDTYANYTDRDYRKLNGALSVLGETEVKQRLGDALGVHLDYFAVLDLDCLRRVVDSIGGVDVEIPQDMSYSDPAQDLHIDLHAGQTHLDGAGAEEFVRYRAGYANADLGRLDAQKLFLKAFAAKCQSLNAAQSVRLVCALLADLQTDIGLPQALRLLPILLKCDLTDLPMATLVGSPIQGRSGAWYYVINRAGGAAMANEYLMPEAPITDLSFDPNGFFDRADHPEFHNIYIAPSGASQ